jgi:amidophosphoribosyltransferase
MKDLHEKCAVVGVWNTKNEVARTAYFALFAQQHRGQEHSGIAVVDAATGKIKTHKGAGLVSQIYTEEIIESLTGTVAIGHNRYSTSHGIGLEHAQPVIVSDTLALAHNGNLPSTKALEAFLESKGVPSAHSSDSEMMARAVGVFEREGHSLPDAVCAASEYFTGAYAAVVLGPTELIAIRDPFGVRPLSIGQIEGGYVVASETCALQTVGATFVRDVLPGEMVIFSEKGMTSVQCHVGTQKLDIFEYVYFARHDSTLLGQSVYETRVRAGEALAREYALDVDVIVPVPETSIPAAIGYARETGIQLDFALQKNRYIHRTFIQPGQRNRDNLVGMKLTAIPSLLKGKRVALVDDSLVRGTTSKKIIQAVFAAGATEVHYLLASPPVKYPDFYGIDTPKQQDLIAAVMTEAEICAELGATSLKYLSLDGLVGAIGVSRDQLCTSCFTGEYPIDLLERRSEVEFK